MVYGADGFWAFEVKNTARVRSQDLHALQSFVSDYPECQPVLLYLRQMHPAYGLIDWLQ